MSSLYISPFSRYFYQDEILTRIPNAILLLSAVSFTLTAVGLIMTFPVASSIVETCVPVKSSASAFRDKKYLESTTHPLEQMVEKKTKEKKSKDSKGNCENNNNEIDCKNKNNDCIDNKNIVTLKEALKGSQFYVILIAFVFGSLCVSTFSSFIKAFGLTYIDNDQFLARNGWFRGITMVISRPLWELLASKFAIHHCIAIDFAALSLLMFSINFTVDLGETGYVLWNVMISKCQRDILCVPLGCFSLRQASK